MNRPNGRTGRFLGYALVGGGEKTDLITPGFGKFGIPEQMPNGIGRSAVEPAPGDIFTEPGSFYIGIAVKIPAKKLKLFPRRGNSFKQLHQINTHPRPAPGGSKGVYANFHSTTISGFGPKGKGAGIFWNFCRKAPFLPKNTFFSQKTPFCGKKTCNTRDSVVY
jgi:hypothetical protein